MKVGERDEGWWWCLGKISEFTERKKLKMLLQNKAVTAVRAKEENSPWGGLEFTSSYQPRGCAGTGTLIGRTVRPEDGWPRGVGASTSQLPLLPRPSPPPTPSSRPLAGSFLYQCGRGRRQMGAADWWGLPSARALSEARAASLPAFRVPAAHCAPARRRVRRSTSTREQALGPRASAQAGVGAKVGLGPALRPAGDSRPWCRGRANSRDLLRA